MSITFVPKHRKRETLFLELFGNPTRPAFKATCLNFYRVCIAGRTVEQAIEKAEELASNSEAAKEAARHFRNALLARV